MDASKWTHFEDDGRDKGVMKLETEVGEGSGRHLPSFVPLFAGNGGGGRDLGRDMPPTATDEMMMMLLLQMAHSSFGSPVQFHLRDLASLYS